MNRYSHWARELDRARRTQNWVTVDRLYTQKTARQIACDIRGGRRINGLKAHETWEAEVHAPDNRLDAHCWSIDIRLVRP